MTARGGKHSDAHGCVRPDQAERDTRALAAFRAWHEQKPKEQKPIPMRWFQGAGDPTTGAHRTNESD